MSQKRPQEEGKARSDGNSPEDKRRRIPTFRSVVQEVMRIQSVQNFLEPVLEPLIRRVVKEEVELALRKHLNSMRRNGEKEINATESRILQLRFLNDLSLPVFTGARIEGEESSALKVGLVDVLTGQPVTSGPESSVRVEIVVLEGDFDGDEGDNWTLEEFKNNIVREREGKKALLTGDAFVMLQEGVSAVGDISFTDNSSWTRSRRFRLGARVVDGSDETRIREARTVSFVVRDHRGELYKKHHPPFLSDEVWRLEKIGKDGAFHKRLSQENIYTVKDFLTLLFVDPSRLRHILGTGMSAKMWEVTVEHARTCVLDSRLYLYCPSGSQQKSGVVFNVVGQVLGLLSECQYMPIDKLPETEKAEAQSLVIAASEHWEEVVSYEDEAALVDGSSNLTSADISNGNKLLDSQKIVGIDYAQPDASSPDIISSIYNVGGVSSLDDFTLHGIEDMGLRYDQPLSYPGQVICDTESISQVFCDDEHLQFFDSDLQSPSLALESPVDLQSAVSGFLLQRTTAVTAVDKAQRRWTKLFSILKWFSIRKLVEKRTRVREVTRYSNGL
ncbi:hypothetical protein SLE2022_289200 [Rubroshorea leprosula]